MTNWRIESIFLEKNRFLLGGAAFNEKTHKTIEGIVGYSFLKND